jgi:hypothetical protein
MYRGFFEDDTPNLYCQIISVKQLSDFFEADFPNVNSITAQKFIQKYNFKDVFQMHVSEKVLKGQCCFDFVREKDFHNENYVFPSNSTFN